MQFVSLFHPDVKKFIIKLDKKTKDRILHKINDLEKDPFPIGCAKIQSDLGLYDGEKVFRVRIGNYRILYAVKYETNHILIVKIDKRSVVYDY